MNEVLAEVIPLGMAVAASPFPIIPAILLLFTPRAKATSLGFLSGWVVGILASTTVFLLLAAVIELFDEPPPWASWTRIVLGTALLILGVRQWRTRADRSEPPAWMQSIGALDPRGALRLGLLLSAANPKVLLLTAAAGLVIGSAELTRSATATTTLVFTAVSASTVALPIALYLVRGERILGPLGRARTWLEAHNTAIMAAVITLIGAVLVAKGASGL